MLSTDGEPGGEQWNRRLRNQGSSPNEGVAQLRAPHNRPAATTGTQKENQTPPNTAPTPQTEKNPRDKHWEPGRPIPKETPLAGLKALYITEGTEGKTLTKGNPKKTPKTQLRTKKQPHIRSLAPEHGGPAGPGKCKTVNDMASQAGLRQNQRSANGAETRPRQQAEGKNRSHHNQTANENPGNGPTRAQPQPTDRKAHRQVKKQSRPSLTPHRRRATGRSRYRKTTLTPKNMGRHSGQSHQLGSDDHPGE